MYNVSVSNKIQLKILLSSFTTIGNAWQALRGRDVGRSSSLRMGPGDGAAVLPPPEKIANYTQKRLSFVHIFVTILYIFVIY